MTLFDADDGSGGDGCATRDQVTALVMYGFREEVVRGWPRERAELTIRRRKARDRADARRAMSRAGLMDDVPHEGGSLPERMGAADAVVQAMDGPGDELLAVLMASLYVLSDAELRAVARELVATYRAVAVTGAA